MELIEKLKKQLSEEYGIHSDQELMDAIAHQKPIDIGVFVKEVNGIEKEERRRHQEELAKREAELAAQNQQEEAAQTSGYPERPQSDIGRTIDNIEREAFARATASTPIREPIVELAPEPVQDPEIPFDPKPSQTVRITGSPEDYQKVIEYIKAMGIDYEEV